MVAYSPLGRGYLTGGYPDVNQDDFRRGNPRWQGPNLTVNWALATTVVELADHRKVAPAQLALAWVLSRGPDVVPIPGTKRVRYVKQNVGALSVELTEADLAALDPLARQVVGERYAPPS